MNKFKTGTLNWLLLHAAAVVFFFWLGHAVTFY